MRHILSGSLLMICLAAAGGCSSGEPPAAPHQAAGGTGQKSRENVTAEPASNPSASVAAPSPKTQPAEPASALPASAAPRGVLSYVPQDAIGALVIHPKRAAASEVGQALLKLDVVQAALRRSRVEPGNMERVIYTMGVPTDESESDCTIIQFASPRPRASLLAREFGELPYEEVAFQGTTYYRFALARAAENDDRSLDTNGHSHETTTDGESRVLARYPNDLRSDDSGHEDGSGSGNWFYQASETQNPTSSEANLVQLNWDAVQQRYQSPKRGNNNVFPAIGEALHPSPDPPCYAVLRWQSRVLAEIRVRGNFRKLADAKDSNGVHVIVFVDGQQDFADDVGPRDAKGIDFDVRASVRPGSVVDFVVDPKADAYWDATKLNATIEQCSPAAATSGPSVQPPVAEGVVEPPASVSTVFFVDDKTIVSTDERRLRALIAGPPGQSPLTKKLSQVDLDHDLVGVVAFDGCQDQAAELLDLASEELGWGRTLAAVPKYTRGAVATLDLTGDDLLRLTIEANDAQSATPLHEWAESLVQDLRDLRDALPQEMPDAAASPLLPLLDDFIGTVAVRQEGLNVVVDAKTPKGLTEFVEKDAADIVSSMRPRRAPPRPGFGATREVELFNGEDLSGWTFVPLKYTKNRTNPSWFVDKERRVLFSTGEDWSDLATVALYQDFDLNLQWRWRPNSEVSPNGSGVVVRAERLDAGEPNLDGLEIDLRPGKDLENAVGTGAFVAYRVSFRNHRAATDGVANRVLGWLREPAHVVGHEWNDLRISCHEDRVTVTLNGVVVNEGHGLSAREGKITLRSQNSGIEFRNIRLTEMLPRLDVATIPDLGPPKDASDTTSPVMEDNTAGGPSADAGTTSRPATGTIIIESAKDNGYGEPGRFQSLLLEHPVDRMVLSEDARYLAASHREANLVSIVDTQSLDLVTTIDTPAPRAMLWRGDHLFAANEGLGTISVFSASGQWKEVKSIPAGDPNPEFMSAPGGRNFRGVIAVRCRGNGRDALPVVIVNVISGRGSVFSNGRTSAANVDYGGKMMIVQSRAGSPNRYITGIFNFAAVSQGRSTPSAGEQVDSFPLLYQVGESPYWFGGRQVFTGMPMKAMIEADRLLVADRIIDVCYAFKANEVRCIGLGRTLEDLGSRPLVLPDRILDVTDIGDLHVAATLGDRLHLFLMDSERTVHAAQLPAFAVPAGYTKTDRAATVAKGIEPVREVAGPDETAMGAPIQRTWTDSSGRFHIEAELLEVKNGQVTLKKVDSSTVTLPLEKLSEADRAFLRRHVATGLPDEVGKWTGAGETPQAATTNVAPKTPAAAKPPAVARTPEAGPSTGDGKTIEVELGGGVMLKAVWIPPGDFPAGSDTKLSVSRIEEGFYMAQTEVTQAQWQAVMGTTPWKREDDVNEGPNHAATDINYGDAVEFCGKLSAKTGLQVRLPKETEWEYACRAGSKTTYCFGDEDANLGDYAWYDKNADDIGEKYAHPVAQKKPNAWGLYDMHGNVAEWCEDWYEVGKDRVHRGGSWFLLRSYCRSANRSKNLPDIRVNYIGFRPVLVGSRPHQAP
ncbi:MAG: formylglycine-generating enzyme family protein [Pirellulaceae bacterium]|nr:formylglycine-generating enzyme family protein [Pirellulaceae bacterium]